MTSTKPPAKGRISNGPGYLPHQAETDEQLELDASNRRRTLRVVLRNVSDADDLVLLAAALELDAELDELTTTSERQQAVELARTRLALVNGLVQD